MRAMTIFPLDITRFPELFEVYFLRWRQSTRVELEKPERQEFKGYRSRPF
jgi:hypothetical protein